MCVHTHTAPPIMTWHSEAGYVEQSLKSLRASVYAAGE